MGPKKKLESQTQKQIKLPTGTSNKTRTIKTSDGGIFQISDNLISRFSGRMRKKIQQFKGDEVLQIDDIDKTTFKYIEEFLSNRKQKQMSQIHFPIRSNISLKYIMDESDATLMERVDVEGGMELVHRLLEAATNLEMEDMRQRLFCLVAVKLARHTVDELKEIFDIPNIQMNEDLVKTEMKSHLEELKKNQV